MIQHERHNTHHRRIQYAANGPDKPAILRLAVSPGAEGVEEENCRHAQPVDERHRAHHAAARLLFARVVALLEQLVHRAGVCSAPDEHAHAAGDQKQQRIHRRRGVNIRRSDAHEQRGDIGRRETDPEHQRHDSKDAQHHAEDRTARGGRLIGLAPLAHHAAHAVLGLKRLFFKEFKLLRLRPAGEEDANRGGDQHQNDAHAETCGQILRNTAQARVRHGGEKNDHDRRDDAHRHRQCDLRRAGLAQRKVSRRLLHRHSPQRRFVRLGFDKLLFFEFVLQ